MEDPPPPFLARFAPPAARLGAHFIFGRRLLGRFDLPRRPALPRTNAPGANPCWRHVPAARSHYSMEIACDPMETIMNEMAPVPARATAQAKIDSLISSELIRGTKVLNAQGEHLGTIMTMMIEKHTGQVAYS